MSGTIVKFSINLLDLPCYFSAKDSCRSITISGELRGLPTKIQLLSDNSPGITRASGESKFFFNSVIIEITDEGENLEQQDFLEGRARCLLMMTYQPIVLEALNRLVLYFKYEMRNPLLKGITPFDLHLKGETAFWSPEWRTAAGRQIIISDTPIESGIISIPGIGFLQDDFFGIQQFSEECTQAFQDSVFSDQKYELTDELLSDAQTSALSNHLRRAVLELAITIEVFVKNTFFKREKIAGSAFEYLEDKGKENVKVLDLLDGASVYAFGESFKKEKPDDYRNIDYIFRCRNKIAHRGEAKYRDDSGNWHEIDFERLRIWWTSSLEMISWLKAKIQQVDQAR